MIQKCRPPENFSGGLCVGLTQQKEHHHEHEIEHLHHLNINLSASKHLPEGAELNLEYAEEYIQKSLGEPSFIGVVHGETGRTIVVQYKYVDFVQPRLYSLARDLKLDFIAYRIQDGATVLGGALVGEYAHEWNYGIFNEVRFIQPMLMLQPRHCGRA